MARCLSVLTYSTKVQTIDKSTESTKTIGFELPTCSKQTARHILDSRCLQLDEPICHSLDKRRVAIAEAEELQYRATQFRDDS